MKKLCILALFSLALTINAQTDVSFRIGAFAALPEIEDTQTSTTIKPSPLFYSCLAVEETTRGILEALGADNVATTCSKAELLPEDIFGLLFSGLGAALGGGAQMPPSDFGMPSDQEMPSDFGMPSDQEMPSDLGMPSEQQMPPSSDTFVETPPMPGMEMPDLDMLFMESLSLPPFWSVDVSFDAPVRDDSATLTEVVIEGASDCHLAKAIFNEVKNALPWWKHEMSSCPGIDDAYTIRAEVFQ